MDRDELLELVTSDDVIGLMGQLGSEYNSGLNNGNEIIFNSICHNSDSHKLYYYKDSKVFHCYTHCGTMSIYDLIMTILNCRFEEAFRYLAKFKNVSLVNNKGVGLRLQRDKINDLEFLNRHLYKPIKKEILLPTYDKRVLNVFDDYYPSVWEEEGLSPEEMKFFNIKFYFNQYKAIIPNYDINGRLIGIRGRTFRDYELKKGYKYMPVTIQKLTYRSPTGCSLYGIYENQDNIRKYKKAIIFEGEKSVIKYGSYYGREKNISLATLGTSMSKYQRDMILNLGVTEVVIAYDKQYVFELIDQNNKKSIIEYNAYIKKIMKIFKLFNSCCRVSFLYCLDDETLDYKDAPIDKGKEVFTELFNNRIIIDNIEELEDEIIEI